MKRGRKPKRQTKVEGPELTDEEARIVNHPDNKEEERLADELLAKITREVRENNPHMPAGGRNTSDEEYQFASRKNFNSVLNCLSSDRRQVMS